MKKQDQHVENRIDRTMHIVGDISFKGTAVIEGCMQGNISGETLIVTETGEIIGDLTMEKVVCSGKITGTITAQWLTVENAAQIQGKLLCETLEIESGAQVDCEVRSSSQHPIPQMIQPPAQPEDTAEEINAEGVPQVVESAADKVSAPEQAAAEKDLQDMPIPSSVLMEEREQDEFFQEGGRETILRSIVEALNSWQEMIKVVGEAGSGKTTFCKKICDELSDSFEVVRLDNAVGSTRDVLLQIIVALDVQIEEECSQADILEELKKILRPKQKTAKPVLLIIDNSHEMYPATLEGIMKNFCYRDVNKEERMQLVLFGNETLNKHLVPRSISYFQEYPECALELRPLSNDETTLYIDFKMAGIQRHTNREKPIDFPASSAAKVYTFSKGVIGKIDRIVEEAVALACNKKSDTIALKFVKNIEL